jgi:hypothetical protein
MAKRKSSKIETAIALPTLGLDAQCLVEEELKKVDNWGFDALEFSKVTAGSPLYYLSLRLFAQHDLLKKFPIDEEKFKRFLHVIESGYNPNNPYHNSTHAADVLQTLHFFLTVGKLKSKLTDLEIFSALLAAIIHDYKHPGLNNSFQVNTHSSLAIRYNDRGVLENMHLSKAFSVIFDEQTAFMSAMSENDRKEIRETVIALVLATDMSQHFDFFNKLKTKFYNNGMKMWLIFFEIDTPRVRFPRQK